MDGLASYFVVESSMSSTWVLSVRIGGVFLKHSYYAFVRDSESFAGQLSPTLSLSTLLM